MFVAHLSRPLLSSSSNTLITHGNGFSIDFLVGFNSKITATMTSKPNTSEASPETQNVADEKARKEELLEARMKMIRKKNEELMKRQKEIEEDRKNADVYSEMAVKKHPENFVLGVSKDSSTPGMGRGRGRGLMLKEMRKETLKAKQWEAKRRENIQKEEEERKRGSNAPRSTPACRFLADDDRVDMSRTTRRNERSWGGASFNKVVTRVQREKEGFPPRRHKGNIEMTMSGRERHEYTQWRKERARIDEERKERQKKSGNWSRAWDQPKAWDSRKKMWAYENNSDDHSFKSTRRQDSENSEDWGSDDRNSRRDYKEKGFGQQGSRHSGGFEQHDKRGIQAGEEWGETAESRIQSECKEKWGESRAIQEQEELESRVSQSEDQSGKTSENKVTMQQKTEWGKSTENRMAQREAEWGETSENRVISSPVEAGSKAAEGPALSHQQHHGATSNDWKGHFSSAENKEENTDTAKVTSESTFHDAPKPQRDIKQRRKKVASAEADSINTNEELVSVTEVQPSVDKEDLSESFANKPESTTVGKDQDQKLESHTVGVPENKLPDDDKQLLEDTSNKGKLTESEHIVHKKEDTSSHPVHSTEREQTTKGKETVSHESTAQKGANLPKLITKADKKVTFDSEENKQAKGSDLQDASSVTIGDIPPTPDFLKYDHTLEWGDIEIEDEDSAEVQPKW